MTDTMHPDASQAAITAAPAPSPVQPAVCARSGCGATFLPKKKWQRFCSARCRTAHHATGADDHKRLADLEQRVAALEAAISKESNRG